MNNTDRLRLFANENSIELPEDLRFNTNNYQRFSAKGSEKDYFYKLLEFDGHICGWFGTWKGGKQSFSWKSWGSDNKELDDKLDSIKLSQEEETTLCQENASEIATSLWVTAKPAPCAHPYLVRKGIGAVGGIRCQGEHLLVPCHDASGKIWGIETIHPDGKKMHTHGSKFVGNYFHMKQEKPSEKAYIVEGYSTGASVFLATGCDVFVVFGSSNLMAATQAIKKDRKRKKLILAPDLDEAGESAAEKWQKKHGNDIVFPEFSGDKGTDFNDLHVFEGIEAVQRCFGIKKPEPLKSFSFENADPASFPPRPFILDPFLRERSIGMIYSKTGSGKTVFTMSMCMYIARSVSFLGWATKQKKIYYIDSEMEMADMLNLRNWIKVGNDLDPSDNIQILNRSTTPEQFFNAKSREWMDRIKESTKDYDIIVFDNVATLFGGDECKVELWEPIKDFFFELRFMGKSVVFLHHAGKNGSQRGTSARVDTCDYVIKLEKTDQKPGMALCLKGTFEKGRRGSLEGFGVNVHLDGLIERIDLNKDLEQEISERYQEGMSVESVAKAMNMSFREARETISRLGILRNRSEGNRMDWRKRKGLD